MSHARARLACVAVAIFVCAGVAADRGQAPSTFAGQIAALSERDGYFDTDNLISNESSYQQVLPELRKRHVRGGAYVGVGPDQNFTYIAETRPEIAFIIDVRRDNLLLQLLFKALFDLSRTRVDYLAQLLGRPVPADPAPWRNATVDRLIAYVEAPAVPPEAIATLRARVDTAITRCGVGLSTKDFQTIDRFHRRFIEEGVSLRFQSTGRPPRSYYPTYRQLLADTDGSGKQGNYLASEDAFQFVKGLEARDLIIPVVGDVSGPSAMAGIGGMLTKRRTQLSTLYISNVEFYLFGDGAFARYVANLGRLPHASNGVVIRSVFGGFAPGLRSGDASVSQVQAIDDLLAGVASKKIQYYADLVGRSR
jgi:hypothetical protein